MNKIGENENLTNKIKENKYSLQQLSDWLIERFSETSPSSNFYKKYKIAAIITLAVYIIFALLILFNQNFIRNLSVICQLLLWIISIGISIIPILIVGILEVKNRKQYVREDEIFKEIIGAPTKNEQILIESIIDFIKLNGKNISNSYGQTIDSISNIFVWFGNICITLYFAILNNSSEETNLWMFIFGLIFSLAGLLIRFVPKAVLKKIFIIDLLTEKYFNWKFDFEFNINVSAKINANQNSKTSNNITKNNKPNKPKSKKK